jgi:16S rRNA C967 or C1407 C5-methylase (RsmB/RsmF family)
MSQRFGEKRAYDLSEIMNHRAPLTLRINPLKISRDNVIVIDYIVYKAVEKSLPYSNRLFALWSKNRSEKAVQPSRN